VSAAALYCTFAAFLRRRSWSRTVAKPGELPMRGAVVAVVDDDPAIRHSLKFSLEIEGFSVRVYPGGAELLNDLDLAAAECLVIDQNMPGMNGLDLVASLRGRNQSAPAILMTSHPTATLRERAGKAGVPIIEKPLLENALIDRIRDVLARH
jgi:FixJ family two-component response regulator